MKFAIILFRNKNYKEPHIIGFRESKLDAETLAEERLKMNTSDAVHVYNWTTGYEAVTRIELDRQWYPPALPAVEPEPKSDLQLPTPASEDESVQKVDDIGEKIL